MSDDYRNSHLKETKGETYSEQFISNPYRSMIWGFEKEVLDKIVKTFLNKDIHHLDFACGTGRILGHIQKKVQRSVGIDLSPSMLKIARADVPDSEIIEADITRDDVLLDQKFNLITAFRFFPNAQSQLREEAMSKLVDRLDVDGIIVFNNHRNTASLLNRIWRLIGRGGNVGMAPAEVKKLLAHANLEIIKKYHINVIPSTDTHMLLPKFILTFLERMLSACPIFSNLAMNHIFVCKSIS